MIILNDIYKESPTKVKSRIRIIDNAFSMFSKKGFDSFILSDIAEITGITTRNLYRYYSSKEALITDVAFHYITKFNNRFPIVIDSSLNGYEQLKDVLQQQIEYKLLSDTNNKIITFIAHFNIYMTKADVNHQAIKNYVLVYAPLLKQNLLANIKKPLVKGVEDKTLSLKMSEVDYYVGYIYNSLMSLMSRIAVKRYEKDIQEYDYIQKHIHIILEHLKNY